MKKNSLKKHITSLAVASTFIAATFSSANAALLPLPALDFPLIVYDNLGSTTFDPVSGVLSTTALPTGVRFNSTDPLSPILIESGESVAINIIVDSAGNLVSGVPGNDLVITGGLDVDGDGIIDVSGELITAEILEFGFLDNGTTDEFNYSFVLTGGALAEFYLPKNLGLSVISARSSFTDFTQSFRGNSNGTFGGISLTPSECNISVLATCSTAANPTSQLTCEIPANNANCSVLGEPETLTFKYTGGGCTASNNAATSAGIKVPECEGTINDTLPILIASSAGLVTPSEVAPGETFTIEDLDSNTTLWLSNIGGMEDDTFHTSCSAPLKVGDVFGSLTLVAFNGQTGDTDVTFGYEITNIGTTVINSTDVEDLFGILPGSPIGTLNPGDVGNIQRIETLSAPITNAATVIGHSTGVTCEDMTSISITQAAPLPPTNTKGSKGSKGSKGKGSKDSKKGSKKGSKHAKKHKKSKGSKKHKGS